MKTPTRHKRLSREDQLNQARRITSVLAAMSVLIGHEVKASAIHPSTTPSSTTLHP